MYYIRSLATRDRFYLAGEELSRYPTNRMNILYEINKFALGF